MKRVLAILLTMVFLFSLAACKKIANNVDSNLFTTFQPTSDTTISIITTEIQTTTIQETTLTQSSTEQQNITKKTTTKKPATSKALVNKNTTKNLITTKLTTTAKPTTKITTTKQTKTTQKPTTTMFKTTAPRPSTIISNTTTKTSTTTVPTIRTTTTTIPPTTTTKPTTTKQTTTKTTTTVFTTKANLAAKKEEIDAENKRHSEAVQQIDDSYNTLINRNNERINSIKAQYGISYVYDEITCVERINELNSEISDITYELIRVEPYKDEPEYIQRYRSLQQEKTNLENEKTKYEKMREIIGYENANLSHTDDYQRQLEDENALHQSNLAKIETKYSS